MNEAPNTRPSLLLRLRDPRDEAAWAEFLEIYEPLVLRLARQKGLQEADAADLCQDVFRAVASAIGRWDPDPARGSFRGWLSRIARNLIVNLLASRRTQPRGSGDSEIGRLLEEQPDPSWDESARFDAEYKRQLFHWAAGQVRGGFTETAWQAFWRTGVDGEAPEAVARDLSTTVGTVYYYKSRVMARIRAKIRHAEWP